jgi:DNA-binding phage protein
MSKWKAGVSHHDREVEELRADRDLETLLALLKTVGMRLSVEPEPRATA